MLNLKDKDKEFILKYLKNGESLIAQDSINAILDPLGDLIDEKGFYGYEYNDFGREAQKVYDSVYYNN